jgi:hypothetical protein
MIVWGVFWLRVVNDNFDWAYASVYDPNDDG